jgi:hypothetical protein
MPCCYAVLLCRAMLRCYTVLCRDAMPCYFEMLCRAMSGYYAVLCRDAMPRYDVLCRACYVVLCRIALPGYTVLLGVLLIRAAVP